MLCWSDNLTTIRTVNSQVGYDLVDSSMLSIDLMEDVDCVLVNIVLDDNYYDKGTHCLVGGEQQ